MVGSQLSPDDKGAMSFVIRYLTSAPRVGVIGLLIFGVWCAAFVFHHATAKHLVSSDNVVIGRDFMAFYLAGALVSQGAGDRLYDPHAQQQTQDAVLAPEHLDGLSYFINPASVAVVYSLLARLPYQAAFYLHTLLMAICFFAGVRLLRPHLPGLSGSWIMLALPAISWFPMMHTITGGQNAALTFLLMAAVYAGTVEGRWWKSGAALGLLLFKPQYAVPLAALLLFRGHFKTLGLTGLLGIGQYFVGGMSCGWDWPLRMSAQLGGYYRLQEDATNSATHISLLETIDFSVVQALGADQPLGQIAHFGGMLLVALLGVALLWIWRNADPRRSDFGAYFALASAATLLLSLHTQYYDGALLILPALLLIDFHARAQRPLGVGLRMALLAGYALYLPAVSFPVSSGIPFQPAVLAVVGVCAWALLMLRPQIHRQHALLLGVAVVAVGLLQFEALNDIDVHWQIKLGQLMWQSGSLVTSDPFTFTHHGAAVPTLGWLAQLIFAAVYDLASWRGVQIVHAALFAGAFVTAAGAALVSRRDRAAPPDLISLGAALFLGFFSGITNSMVRPQSFAALCFAILLVLVCGRWRRSTKLLLAVPLLLLWQNLHPSVLVGAVLLAGLAGSAWLQRFRGSPHADPWSLTIITGFAGLAQLATPMGWTIFQTSAANVHVARDVLGVSEWLPPWDPAVRGAMVGFGCALLITTLLLVRLRGRVRLDDLACLVVLTGLSLTAARFSLFWSIGMVPLWARWIAQARPVELRVVRGDVPAPARVIVLLALLGVPAALILPTVLQRRTVDAFTLQAGLSALQQSLPEGRVYNYREWGGPLILAGHPRWQVAYDGRLYLFDEDDWQSYRDVALGTMPLPELQAHYQPDAFFLRPSFHERLIRQLDASPEWQRVHMDGHCSVHVRRSDGAGLAGWDRPAD